MLLGAQESIRLGKISYVFVSTHSQELHLWCKKFLETHGFIIIASADYDSETFCYDGILVAKYNTVKDSIEPRDIGKRSETTLMPHSLFLKMYIVS